MKITLTQTELINAVKVFYNLTNTPEDIQIVIESPLSDECQKFLQHVEPLLGGFLIPPIKAVREFIPNISLSDAKWVVQNFDVIKEFIEKHNRLPKWNVNGGCNDRFSVGYYHSGF